jgi:isopenicillin-N epimerase
MFEFGEKTRKRFYLLDETIHFTNHGSYGAVPKPIQNKRIELLQEMEKAPDAWFRVKSFKLWNSNRQSLASFLNVDSENIVLTENATDAINSVLKATTERLTKNDAILAHEYTYAAVLNAIDYVAKYRFAINDQINVFKVPCKYPINSIDEVLNAYDSMCEKIIVENKLILSLVVLDHISSATATLFPVEEIIKVIRKWEGVQERKIKVLIDGAHAIGQIDIKLNQLDCDFYVSNLHKWFLAPRGCAFLYFKDKNETYSLKPNIISHGYGKEATKNFFERATRDSTSWYLIDDCIKIYENDFGGLNTITEYTSKLLEEAVEMLVSGWGTGRISMPKELEAPFMKLIKFPELKAYKKDDDHCYRKAIESLMIDFYRKYNLIACVVPIHGELYCRISAFVYNQMKDFESLRDAVLKMNE